MRYQINGGAWTNAPDQTGTQFQVTNARPGDAINIRVASKSDMGISAETLLGHTTPLWTVANLVGSWECYQPSEATYPCPSYTLSDSGMVVVRGLAKGDGSSTTIFTLPAGLRPQQQQVYPTSAGDAIARVDAATNGNIVYSFGNSASYISLDMIRFVAVGTPGVTWNTATITTANGWSNYGGSFGSPRYTLDASGRVVMAGLLQGTAATISTGSTMITYPAGYQPPLGAIYPGLAASAFYVNQQSSSSSVITRNVGAPAAANSWNSIGSIYYPSGTSVTQIALPLSNSWIRYSTSFNTPEYAKGSDGIVSLRGLVKSGTTARYTVVGTLPPGYRPGKSYTFIGVDSSTTSQEIPVRYDVNTDGTIKIMNLLTDNVDNGYMSLEGIHFYQEL